MSVFFYIYLAINTKMLMQLQLVTRDSAKNHQHRSNSSNITCCMATTVEIQQRLETQANKANNRGRQRRLRLLVTSIQHPPATEHHRILRPCTRAYLKRCKGHNWIATPKVRNILEIYQQNSLRIYGLHQVVIISTWIYLKLKLTHQWITN